MAALDTPRKIIAYARILLQDTLEPFRYSDDDLISALNIGLLDARRLRPDLFLYTPTEVPFYEIPFHISFPLPPDYVHPYDEALQIDQQYRMALVYFVAGQTQMRDEEDVTDARAVAFLGKFTSLLTEPLMPQSIAR
jgi:hypothetical protein